MEDGFEAGSSLGFKTQWRAFSNDERGGRGTRAIKIGRFNTSKVRTEFDNWGRKDAKTLTVPNSFQTGVRKY